MADFDVAIPKLLKKEGGLSNDKNDRGGLTKYGIAQKFYPTLDIANLTEENAKSIYRRDYWNPLRLDEIESQTKAELLFESGVNFGITTIAKIAQRVVDVKDDGAVGTKTLEAINAMDDTVFVLAMKLAAVDRYRKICNADKDQKVFLLGWLNRILGGA